MSNPGKTVLDELVRLAAQCDDLDEIVHDLASSHASGINNQGWAAQVGYIVQMVGTENARQLLTEGSSSTQVGRDG